MKISAVTNRTYNYQINNYKLSNFKGNISIPTKKVFVNTEHLLNFCAILKRKLSNKIKNFGDQEKILAFYKKFINVSDDSYAYMRFFHNFARKFAKNREVEINLESNRLLDIAKSDEAYIFIMSHSDGKKDPAMMGVLGTLLSGAYINLGKAKVAPRAKVIANEDILTSMNKIQRAIYEKFGAFGVNANLFDAGKGKNSVRIHQLIESFCKDKNHIFIFPEGKMGMFKDLDLKYKFQPGIGGIVRSSLKNKKQVKVVPIGFAYNNQTKTFLGSIYIGKPVCFRSEEDKILVNQANIDINMSNSNYKRYWNYKQYEDSYFKVITHEGNPVFGQEQSLYIAGVLCENLRICKEKANQQLPQESMNINEIIKI